MRHEDNGVLNPLRKLWGYHNPDNDKVAYSYGESSSIAWLYYTDIEWLYLRNI